MTPRNARPSATACLDAALAYAKEQGWRVFPLDGKRPFAGTRGHHDASTDATEIRNWWRKWPHANVGIACSSQTGPIVIDVDGTSGAEAIAKMLLPSTREARSRKGRSHFYFDPVVDGTAVRRTIRPMGKDISLDVLGDGGYVVAPPSIHPGTGRPYEWSNRRPLAPFPPEALTRLVARQATRVVATPIPKAIVEGERNARLAQFAGTLRRKGDDAPAILEALRAKNEKDCVPPLADDEIRSIAQSIARYQPEGCVVEQSATLRVVASARGRARCSVVIYNISDLDNPLLVDKIDVTSRAKRAHTVAQLPDDLRNEAGELLTRLAVTVSSLPTLRAAREADTVDPFPPTRPWGKPVGAASLLAELSALIRQYVVLPKYGAEAVALWIVHTYVLEAADFTPYLHITSPVRECGKSTLLDLLAELANRAQMTGGITAAALYRRIDRLSPSILLDELDTRLHDEGGDYLKRVLNTGYSRRQGRMTVCVGDDNADTDFSTFCPKVLAGIGDLWDTVTSRSIPLHMQRASAEEMARLVKIRGDRIAATCLPYRRRLVRFAADNLATLVASADPSTPRRLSARQADVWRPLFAIADLAGGKWPRLARRAALKLHSRVQETDRGLLLLRDLQVIFEKRKSGALTSDEVVQALLHHQDGQWFEFRQGRPITARGVAVLLARFGVRPKVYRPDGSERTVRGYSLVDLRPVFGKYLPAPVSKKEEHGRHKAKRA